MSSYSKYAIPGFNFGNQKTKGSQNATNRRQMNVDARLVAKYRNSSGFEAEGAKENLFKLGWDLIASRIADVPCASDHLRVSLSLEELPWKQKSMTTSSSGFGATEKHLSFHIEEDTSHKYKPSSLKEQIPLGDQGSVVIVLNSEDTFRGISAEHDKIKFECVESAGVRALSFIFAAVSINVSPREWRPELYLESRTQSFKWSERESRDQISQAPDKTAVRKQVEEWIVRVMSSKDGVTCKQMVKEIEKAARVSSVEDDSPTKAITEG